MPRQNLIPCNHTLHASLLDLDISGIVATQFIKIHTSKFGIILDKWAKHCFSLVKTVCLLYILLLTGFDNSECPDLTYSNLHNTHVES